MGGKKRQPVQCVKEWSFTGVFMIVPALLPEIKDTGQVLYRSDMTYGKNKKNFELLPAEEFKAGLTQHIPEKGFHMGVTMAGTQTGSWRSGGRMGC